LRKAYQNSNHLFFQVFALKQVHISQVKPEFRSLGIVAKHEGNGFLVVGTVYRGRDTLDGVMSCKAESGLADAVVDMIKGSKHFGQVRIIVLDENILPEPITAETIWEGTGKPVLIFASEEAYNQRYYLKYRGKTIQAAGIDEGSAIRVLDRIMTEEGVKAVKIADIILNRIPKLHNV
jgi:endonuclease V-like protein UPF0215 family